MNTLMHTSATRQAGAARERGIFLIEIAVALLVLGMIAAAAFPLLNMSSRMESESADRSALQQTRDGLLALAVRNGGFPAPLALQASGTGALSRTTLAAPTGAALTVVTPDQNPYGAVPSHLLGTPRTSSKGTLFNYDVHPALRADQPFNLSGLTVDSNGLASLHDMNRNNQGTGGTVSQMCRNLNTLIDMERRLQADAGAPGTYRVTMPRTWQNGVASNFNWNGSLFVPTAAMDAAVTNAWILQRSTPAAFVVTRPHPLGLARLDRANTVFAADTPSSLQMGPASADKGYRTYEAPSTSAFESAADDLRDYGGASTAVSLLELRSALQAAGQCMRGPDICMNTEIQITMDNALTGQYYIVSDPRTASGSPIGLPLYWTVNAAATSPALQGGTAPAAQPADKLGTVAGGTSVAACVPVLDTSASFTSMPARTLNLFTVLPDGRYWSLGSLPLHGNGGATLPADDVLDSGKSHAVTVKCFASSPVEFEFDTPSTTTYKISTGGANAVSCTVTND